MGSDEELMSDIVDEALVDWIDLGHALAVVKMVEGGENRMERYRRAAPLMIRLVLDGRLTPGEIGSGEGSFVPWAMSAGEAAELLERHFDQVLTGEKPLNPWEPCLFADAGSDGVTRGRREQQRTIE